MKIETLKKRLDKNRPLTEITLKIPSDVLEDLKRVAIKLGFTDYQPLIKAYIGPHDYPHLFIYKYQLVSQ